MAVGGRDATPGRSGVDWGSVGVFFYILSIYTKKKGKHTTHNNTAGGADCQAWAALAALGTTAAMLSKEQGFTVLGLCLAYELVFVARVDLSGVRAFCSPPVSRPFPAVLPGR